MSEAPAGQRTATAMALLGVLALAASAPLAVSAAAHSHHALDDLAHHERFLMALASGVPLHLAAALPSVPADGHAPPGVPPHIVARVQYKDDMVGVPASTAEPGSFVYDRPGRRYRTTYRALDGYFHRNFTQDRDSLSVGPSSNLTIGGAGRDGGCMAFPSTQGADYFGWLQGANLTGSRMFMGSNCTEWELSVDFPGGGGSLVAFVRPDGIPLFQNTSITFPTAAFRTEATFLDPREAIPSESEFEPTEACSARYPAPPCEGDDVQTLTVYRIFGQLEPVALADRNAGDVLGDLAFVCTQAASPLYEQKLIAKWTVDVSTAFGQYALCNFQGGSNRCQGTPVQLSRVGRRSGQLWGQGPRLGQCSPNEDVGSQYSFSAAAQCPDGTRPAAGSLALGCGWGMAEAVRVIEAECLISQRGLLQACADDRGNAPFSGARRVWELAFASSDPSMGGCPDARPAEAVLMT